MQPIHIEPEAIRELSRLMENTVRLLLDEEFAFKQAVNRLEMDWQGTSSGQFFTETKVFELELHERIKEMYFLCLRLEQVANAWEESDYTWQSHFFHFYGGS